MAIGVAGARCPFLFASLPRLCTRPLKHLPNLSHASFAISPAHSSSLSTRLVFAPTLRSGRQLLVGRIQPNLCSGRRLSIVATKVAETADATLEDKTDVSSSSSSPIAKFKKRLRIADIKAGDDGGLGRVGETMVVRGWVRTCRLQKTFTFIEVRTYVFVAVKKSDAIFWNWERMSELLG